MRQFQTYPLGLASLTRRERDVLVHAVRGARNGEIALQLGIRPVTVESHLTQLYRKLEVRSRVELVVAAARWGLIEAMSRAS